MKHKGFTIVELLIVIVVIGILAAITIVAYSGLQNRARISAVESLLRSNSSKVMVFKNVYGGYPTVDELRYNRAPGSTVDNSGPQEARIDVNSVSTSNATASNGTTTVRYIVDANNTCAWFDFWDYTNGRPTVLHTGTPRSRKIDC